ncbi:MAG TPA: DUF2461 domain-containing protein [Acidimicrobiia bacterium]|nr:DUF2461 domain-containing protein [Acidimicrobiia bacterium]
MTRALDVSKMTFRGWPEAALTFYAGLETDNSKAYWQAHRATYDEGVKQPFLDLSPLVQREFGPLHLFRPNRDTRFSKDKSPYKTAAAAVTEGPGGAAYYVQISAEGLYVGSGYYMFAPDQLERYRAAVADARKGPVLDRAVTALRAGKYEVAARESLKRVPRGFDPDHPRAELLRMKGLHAGRSFGSPRWLHSAGALDRIVATWKATAPMNRWLDRHVGPSTLAPPEPD